MYSCININSQIFDNKNLLFEKIVTNLFEIHQNDQAALIWHAYEFQFSIAILKIIFKASTHRIETQEGNRVTLRFIEE